MTEKREIDIKIVKTILAERNIEFREGVAYIMPESSYEGVDTINEYAPDLRKDLKDFGIESVVVRGESHNYLALRSIDAILPFIFGIPFSVYANFITDWIKDNLGATKNVKLRFIKEEDGKYKEISAEGTANEIKEILESLKEH